VKSVKLNGEFFIKEFVAGLEKTLAD